MDSTATKMEIYVYIAPLKSFLLAVVALNHILLDVLNVR